MRKQFKLWFKGTVASVFVAIWLHANGSMAGPMDVGQAAGVTSANQALSLYGTKAGSNANISVPMTNSTTQLSTINGATSFNANLTTPSSAAFLAVLMQPSTTGDLQQLIVSEDLNTDGKVDYVYTVPRMVSGVCANGYYSCTAGTWTNCQPYKWVSDNTGKISDVSAGPTDLGGCYCINTSCGSNLVWTNSAIVLKDLGGGIVAAMQKADVNFTITSVTTTPVQISYYGNLTGNASVQSVQQTQNLPPPVTAQNYFTNYASMNTDLTTLTASQGGDPSSIYYNVINANSVKQSKGTDSTCSISRSLSLNTTTQSFSNTGTRPPTCMDHLLYMQIWQANSSTYKLQYMDTGIAGYPAASHAGCSTAGTDTNGWWTIDTVIVPPPSATSNVKFTTATFDINGVVGAGCIGGDGSTDGILQGFNHPVQTATICPGGGVQYPTFNWSYDFVYSHDQLVENVTDQCATMASDPTCSVKDETDDGVVVVQDYATTGLQALPSCVTLTGGAVGPMQVCRPWLQIQRTYTCNASNTWDFSNIKQRANTIVGSTTQNGNALNYSDTTLGSDGKWTSGSGTGTLPTGLAVDPCELSCKTQTTPGSTQVTVSGNVSQLRTNPSASTDYAYKLCVNGQCPLDTGETIVTDCSCLSDFNAAFAAIQAVRLAGKDIICTSGALKSLD